MREEGRATTRKKQESDFFYLDSLGVDSRARRIFRFSLNDLPSFKNICGRRLFIRRPWYKVHPSLLFLFLLTNNLIGGSGSSAVLVCLVFL